MPTSPSTPSPDELAARVIGERIQNIRTRTGRTRAVIAGLVGRSEDWLRDVEKGRLQHPPGLEMLLKIGQALGVRDLTEITGEHQLLVGISRRAGHPVVPEIREAIEGVDLRPTPSPVDAAELAARVERAWRLWHTSTTPRADAGATLPPRSPAPTPSLSRSSPGSRMLHCCGSPPTGAWLPPRSPTTR